MRELIVALPLWAIMASMVLFFWAVTMAARLYVLRRRDLEARTALAEQATSLLTGVAATFAFFVGFAISASWGAVTAGQTAVEQQATAVHQMAWELDNISDRAESTALMDKLRVYAATVANDDDDSLIKGTTINGTAAHLPSAVPLDQFENALHAYAYGPKAPERQATTLISAASALSNSAAAVEAVANRALPRPLVVLLVVVGILSSILMGISTVTYSRPSMIFIWCLIPALSITTVVALAYPFALRSGVNLAPMRTVAEQLARS